MPKPVQKYLTYTGVIGIEKVHSFRVIADGEIKMNRDSDWAKIEIEQNNFIGNEPVRLFYLRMNMFGIPIDYKEINGFILPSYGEAIWNLPEGDYSYCKFTNIKSIIYNEE